MSYVPIVGVTPYVVSVPIVIPTYECCEHKSDCGSCRSSSSSDSCSDGETCHDDYKCSYHRKY